jgi:hypothetical protein
MSKIRLPILCIVLGFLTACQGNSQVPGTASTAEAQSALSTGNIFWKPPRLRLRYPAEAKARATLTYWGPDGYFTEPISCNNGGQISDRAGKPYGSPSGYMHVVYSFKAMSKGPATCGFDAVLNNTGSPPIAVLELRIRSH